MLGAGESGLSCMLLGLTGVGGISKADHPSQVFTSCVLTHDKNISQCIGRLV